jgi:hypothetical protein
MRGSAVAACAALAALMVAAQLFICAGMKESVRSASSDLGTHLRAELDSREPDDPEWQPSCERSRAVPWINKAVHNGSWALFRVQLLLGAAAIGVVLVYGRKGGACAEPDSPRVQPDAAPKPDPDD